MLDFNYSNDTRIAFGRQSEEQLPSLCEGLGQRLMLVYGGGSVARSGLLARTVERLQGGGCMLTHLAGVQPNPRMGLVYEGVKRCAERGVQGILALGGGSCIDTAKAIAMGARYEGDAWDFFTGSVAESALPIGVVLTIPAAGSESSSDCVLTNENGMLKRASCACDFLRPRFAVLNPELTYTLPGFQTACGACDIMAHVMERYFTTQHDVDVSDRLCEALLCSVMRAAAKLKDAPRDYDARAELMWAGTLAHNSLVGMGRVSDWASHGMGHEVSALYDATHGATLAAIFPAWMKYVTQMDVPRFAQFASRVFDVPYLPEGEDAMAREGIARFERFVHHIGLSTRLKDLGVREEDLPLMAQKCAGQGTIGGFRRLNRQDAEAIYRLAYE